MTLTALAEFIAKTDPDDLDAWREILYERQRLVETYPGPAEAVDLYRLGEVLEQKLRISRAKIAAQCSECYQTAFLLKALSADLAPTPESGSSLDVKA